MIVSSTEVTFFFNLYVIFNYSNDKYSFVKYFMSSQPGGREAEPYYSNGNSFNVRFHWIITYLKLSEAT